MSNRSDAYNMLLLFNVRFTNARLNLIHLFIDNQKTSVWVFLNAFSFCLLFYIKVTQTISKPVEKPYTFIKAQL